MSPPKYVAPKVRIRGMILTASIAAITIVGTMVGAGIKTDIEAKEVGLPTTLYAERCA
jgi:hypothetical protein